MHLMTNKFLAFTDQPFQLPQIGGLPAETHVFEEQTVEAINTAIAARRPLLILGEPGVGKSQLARAAAHKLNRAFVTFVVDSRTESRDLLWRFDAVERLADAQICGQIFRDFAQAKAHLSEEKYIRPGPLWWALDWNDASRKSGNCPIAHHQPEGWTADSGVVLLIDEIDKGESDVPNGLLESLGSHEITLPFGTSVVLKNAPPLVFVTTNAERMLPDAFLRRCLVLHLSLPTDRSKLIAKLIVRGRAHFADADEQVLKYAAEQLVRDRSLAQEAHVTPLPGQAEYLDLIRAVTGRIQEDPSGRVRSVEEQIALLDRIKGFVLNKRLGTEK